MASLDPSMCCHLRQHCFPPPPSLQLLRDTVIYKARLLIEEGSCDTVTLAAKLSSVGYSVSVRHTVAGGQMSFKNLKHEYLLVKGEKGFEGAVFTVDAHFKERFCIPQVIVYSRSKNSYSCFFGCRIPLNLLFNSHPEVPRSPPHSPAPATVWYWRPLLKSLWAPPPASSPWSIC
jgi:hypothetical protein